MKNYLSLLVGFVIIFAALGLIGYVNLTPPTEPAPLTVNEVTSTDTIDLELISPSAYLLPLQTATLTLKINSSERATGAAIELEYDPGKVQVLSVQRGEFFANTLSAPQILPQQGIVKFTYAAPPDSGGKSGSGTLATLSIKPLVSGNIPLHFSPNNLAYAINSSGQAIVGNTLRTLNAPTLTARLSADFNADGTVNLADYNIFVGAYGTHKEPTAGPADLNENGAVDLADYNLFVAAYGQTL